MIFQRSLACATKKRPSFTEGSTTTAATAGRGVHVDAKILTELTSTREKRCCSGSGAKLIDKGLILKALGEKAGYRQ
jgi:hypothetical protein